MQYLLIILSVLPALLAGDFTPQTLSVAEQDSILEAPVANPDTKTRYRLECENEQKIYRHSKTADWYIVDTMRHSRKQLGEGIRSQESGVRIRDAVMSPNGRYVAFASENNLYIHKCDFGTEVAVTKEEDIDIISGISDWLYEEEFGTTALFAWSPDSKQLAFVRLDEHEVPSFSWQTFVGPQYPASESLRYPKAGCPNAKATVCVYDVATKGILTMNLENIEYRIQNTEDYFPRLRWTEDGQLLVLRLNRDQNKMEVLSCNPKSTVAHPLYKEESKNYFIDYSLFDQWLWLLDGRFIVLSEKDGWRRAYLFDKQGMELRALTPENIDVTALYAVDEKAQTLFYQAATTPATRDVYALNWKKNSITKLSEKDGCNSARFSHDAQRYILCHHSFDTPNTYTL